MTCAGIASLHLLGREYEKPTAKCGSYEYDSQMQNGIYRMLQQVGEHRGSWSMHSTAYARYALERVGIFLDLKDVGGFDWYRWGARQILEDGRGRGSLSDFAFDLLFLAKGEAQVAVAKWHWSGDWNNDHRDVKTWVAAASEDLGLKLDWVPARLDRMDSPAAKSSLIFVNGHKEFTATEEETRFLREFLARRGTLVAEGCCGSRVFIDSFRDYVRAQLYPGSPLQFVDVTAAHPICNQRYSVTPEDVAGVQVKSGCRRRRIIILNRDISCALNGEPGTEKDAARARKVSVNLLQWAVRAKFPRGKLASLNLVEDLDDLDDLGGDEERSREEGLTSRYSQAFGRLIHRGEWDVDLAFFPTLNKVLSQSDIAPEFDGEVFVHPQSDDLYGCAVLYVTGHEDPRLRKEEWLPFRAYLQNGGTIVASACCGREEFDRGFRRLMEKVLPNDAWEEVPARDAVWGAPYARKTIPVEGTRAYSEKYKKKLAPLYGIRREGRWIVLYSPVDLCCDLEGDLSEETVAYRRATSVPIWINVLHYALSP
jgi:hypothetical protein